MSTNGSTSSSPVRDRLAEITARKLAERRDGRHRVRRIGASTPSQSVPYRVCDSAEFSSLYADANVPARHTHTVPDDQCPAQWRAQRDKLVSSIGRGFLIALLGNRGTGKTQMAQQAVLVAAGHGRSALYERAMGFFLELRATFHATGRSELDVVDKYREPTLLVLDEFQERAESDFEQRMLAHLIDCRYGDMHDTLIVANQTPERFQTSAGESISDRLLETGGIIECTWESFRGATECSCSADCATK